MQRCLPPIKYVACESDCCCHILYSTLFLPRNPHGPTPVKDRNKLKPIKFHLVPTMFWSVLAGLFNWGVATAGTSLWPLRISLFQIVPNLQLIFPDLQLIVWLKLTSEPLAWSSLMVCPSLHPCDLTQHSKLSEHHAFARLCGLAVVWCCAILLTANLPSGIGAGSLDEVLLECSVVVCSRLAIHWLTRVVWFCIMSIWWSAWKLGLQFAKLTVQEVDLQLASVCVLANRLWSSC